MVSKSKDSSLWQKFRASRALYKATHVLSNERGSMGGGLVEVIIVIVFVAAIIGVAFTQIAGTNTSDWPPVIGTLWHDFLPIVLGLFVILAIYLYLKSSIKGGL